MRLVTLLPVAAIAVLLAARPLLAQPALEPEMITVGVVDALSEEEGLAVIREKLQAGLDSRRWSVRVVSVLSADETEGIDRLRPDFVLAAADLDQQFRAAEKPAPYRIATRKTNLAADAARSAGALLVVRRDRTDLQALPDLKGKTVAAGLPTSLTGWLALEAETKPLASSRGRFWSEAHFLSSPFPDVLSALLAGHVDAAVLPTCFFERMARDGAADVANLRVVNEKTDEALACRRSTALYPDVSMWGFEWTHEERVRAFTVGLLSQPAGSEGYEWLSFVPHTSVESLYKTLEIGPYAYLRDTSLRGLYSRYQGYVHAALLFLLLLIAYEVRLQRLVKLRTAELCDALIEQRRIEADARRDRDRLGSLEKRNIVSQMSAMIAHEVKSPVAAIGNFKAILDYVLPEAVRSDKTVKTALSGIETEAERIAGIVNRVRNYAKSRQTAHVPCDLTEIVRRAVKSLKSSSAGAVPVTTDLPATAPVLGDALELELLVFNLMKNACEALANVKHPKICVTLAEMEGRRELCVKDNGPVLDDAAFRHLQDLMSSVKPEGLGLGLSIVRGIADSHGAGLFFERNPDGGLTVRLVIDKLADDAGAETK